MRRFRCLAIAHAIANAPTMAARAKADQNAVRRWKDAISAKYVEGGASLQSGKLLLDI